jgi:uncharacterized membrane protein
VSLKLNKEDNSAESKIDFNAIIGNILRYGVTLSSVLVVASIAFIFAGHASRDLPNSVSQLIQTNYGRPTVDFDEFVSGILSLNPMYILQLGFLILLATPIVRVGASIVLFAFEKDKAYVLVTTFVFVVLLFSIFVVGPIEAR